MAKHTRRTFSNNSYSKLLLQVGNSSDQIGNSSDQAGNKQVGNSSEQWAPTWYIYSHFMLAFHCANNSTIAQEMHLIILDRISFTAKLQMSGILHT